VTVDLADRAEKRAAFAALAGTLLLAEPGPALREHVAGVPALAALASAATAVDFERIFLRSVQPYESVFRSDTAERGGAVALRVADTYDELGFDEHRTQRWRVAGPDHLGLELRAHAAVIALEAAAWRGERPDEAARHVETERRFFADHLAWWGQVALDALAEVAAGTPYAPLIDEVSSFLAEEIDLLRPLPLLDTSQLAEVHALGSMGPSRLARHLLAPARSGIWLSTQHIAVAAGALGFPWRPMDGRQNLTPLVAAAFDAGEIAELVTPWIELTRSTRASHLRRADEQPGAEVAWRHAAHLAEATLRRLETLGESALDARADDEIVVRIAGADVQTAVDMLRARGFSVDVLAETGD
jgi:TorA maturation chaperone TorD